MSNPAATQPPPASAGIGPAAAPPATAAPTPVPRAGGAKPHHVHRSSESDATVRVGFRYGDGEILSPEREALSEDEELPVAVIDLGDGEWLTLAELRSLHAERLEQALEAWE